MSNHYTVGEALDVRVEKIVPRGLGLAFAEKLTVLVPLASAGDLLRVRIRELKKRVAFAEIVEVKEPGPDRIAAPCPYFGACGGCDFQQMSYEAQLQAKVGIIQDCLKRIGQIEYDEGINIIPSPKPFEYRSRARWHLDRAKKAIGYYARDSHDVIDVTFCPKLTPALQSAFEGLRESIDWAAIWTDQAEMEAAADDEGRVSLFSEYADERGTELSYELDGNKYRFTAETFFQANKLLIPALVDAAIGNSTGESSVDLYAGVGLFTLPSAQKWARVTAVEANPVSADFARRNVADAKLANVKVINQSVDRFLGESRGPAPDFVLIDPPRSGPEKHTIPALAALSPGEISYVSCEPSILARDLRMLLGAGYRIDTITAIDLFPQTHHVETVVRLRLA